MSDTRRLDARLCVKGYEEEHTKFRGTSKKDQFDSSVDGSWLDRWDN